MACSVAIALFAGCASAPSPAAGSRFSGSLTWPGGDILPAGSELVVELRAGPGLDAAVLAERRAAVGGRSAPLPFELQVDPKIDTAPDRPASAQTPAPRLRAAILQRGRPLWATAPLPVGADAGPVALGLLPMTAVEFMAYPSTLHCGDQTVTMGFDGDELLLHIGDERLRLRAPPGGPYTLFTLASDPRTSFLSGQRGGTLKLHGRFLPECSDAATPAVRLTGAEWVIEDIGGGGVIDNSRATLVFAADGVLTGRASCNVYRARYTLGETTLAVSGLTLTDKVCAPSLMQQELRFLDLLARALTYSFSDTGALLLDTADGQRLLARRQ